MAPVRRLGHPLGLLLFTSGLWGCVTAAPASDPAFPPTPRVPAIAFSSDGTKLYGAIQTEDRCRLVELDPASGSELSSRTLAACPTSLQPMADGSLLLRNESGGSWADDPAVQTIVAAATRTDFVRREGSSLVWVRGDQTLRLPSLSIRDMRILDREGSILAILEEQGSESLVRINGNGELTRLVAEPLLSIDSFDISPDQKEFVLSASRSGGFDVALGSTASPSVRWVATDPLDEVLVSWAPRGSKVTYLVRGRDGSLLRSLHVPTGYSLTVDLPQVHVTALAWEPRAERYAIVASTPESSSHIQSLAYGGEARRVVLEPARVSAGELEPFLWPGGSAWLSRPSRIGYGSSYPVVIWMGVGSPFEWSDQRAGLHEQFEAVSILGAGRMDILTSPFWDALALVPWVDRSRVVVVDASHETESVTLPPGVTVIHATELSRISLVLGAERTK